MLDGGLSDPSQGHLHDRILGKDAEIRLGYDLKFHPRNFTEHDGKLLVELNDDDNTICIAKSDSEIEASDVIIFAFAVTLFNNLKEAIERTLEAMLAEVLQTPLKTAIDKTNDFIEIDLGMGDGGDNRHADRCL